MRRAVLADTGPLYAAADPDDARHRQSGLELDRLARDKFEVLVAWPTLMEAYTLVLRRLGHRAAERWLDNMLQGAVLIQPTEADYQVAAKLVRAYRDQPITLFDATVAALGSRLSMEIWTYDHHFDVLRAAVWR